MFRKKCPRCSKSISRKFRFCPFCRAILKQTKEEDFGMLGETDEVDEVEEVFGKLNAPILDKMLSGAMKMLEKEMRGLQETEKQPKANFQLYINGKKVNMPNPEQNSGQISEPRAKIKRQKLPMPSEKTIRNAAGLPRKEAQTSLKRLANKIVYEIEAPGTNSISKVLINKIEDGIEVRIFTKKAVLCKNIAIKLPLIAYYLEKQKLFLEFGNK